MCGLFGDRCHQEIAYGGGGRATGAVASGTCGDYCAYVGGGQGGRTVWSLGLWPGQMPTAMRFVSLHRLTERRFLFELDRGPTPRTNKNLKNARRVQSCGSDRQAWPLAQAH